MHAHAHTHVNTDSHRRMCACTVNNGQEATNHLLQGQQSTFSKDRETEKAAIY